MKERERAVQAARSYIHNRDLKPKIEARLARAIAGLESYLLLHETESVRLGRYRVALVAGELVVSELPPEGWEQLELSGLGEGSPQEAPPTDLDSGSSEGVE